MTQQASTDGQIGGNAVVHLSLPLPPTATPATVTWPLGGRNGPYTITATSQFTSAGTTLTQTQTVRYDPPQKKTAQQ